MPPAVLGINDGHNATACLIQGGRVVACASEERFNRIKNYSGFPQAALAYCLAEGRVSPSEIEAVAIATRYSPWSPSVESAHGGSLLVEARALASNTALEPVARAVQRALAEYAAPKSQAVRLQRLLDCLDIPKERVSFVDHHTAHAYTALFASPFYSKEDALVMTNDGWGDHLCASVWAYKDDKFDCISKTYYTNSIGSFYERTTRFLGLKAGEDEHKVMGLAAYVNEPKRDPVYDEVRKTFRVNPDLSFESKVPAFRYDPYVDMLFRHVRFDHVAGAVQAAVEDVLLEWTETAVSRTGLENLAVAGGTYLNVKANMKIAKMKQIKQYFVVPSAGDESTAIGAAYWAETRLGHKNHERIKSIYWGPEFDDANIADVVEGSGTKGWRFEKLDNVESYAAEVLRKGAIVARFSGRMEFGARALGNRSILTDASDTRVITKLNRSIKSRDFWMPFAPSLLRGAERKYVTEPNPEKTDDQYMVIAFESTALARSDLAAALHPYDGTLRPQVVDRDWNPSYHRLIENFASVTGRAGVLNTSFNLHGEPIVCSPLDAISTFERSGLEYLALGQYMLTKNS